MEASVFAYLRTLYRLTHSGRGALTRYREGLAAVMRALA